MGALLAFGILQFVDEKFGSQVLHKEDLGDFSRCYTGLGKQHDRAGSQGGRLAGEDGIWVSSKKHGLFSL